MPQAKRKMSSAAVAKEEIVRMRAAERRVLIMEGEQRNRHRQCYNYLHEISGR